MMRAAGSTARQAPWAASRACPDRQRAWRGRSKSLSIVAAALVALGAFALLGLGRADAGYDEGMAAFAEGDYGAAYKELRPLAERGEPGAQFTLGFMYDYGQGVPQNTQEAIWWYRNAAEQGIAVAQFSLGEIYEGGRGTPKDLVAAFRWYSLAAENLSPGEIRESVIERRDALAGKLSPAQRATVAALLSGTPQQQSKQQTKESAQAAPADAAPTVSDAALVALIQGELARLGYELDWQLGSLDKLTRGAIQAFEIETGREITGRASKALLEALRATERPRSVRDSKVAAKDDGPAAQDAAQRGDGAAAAESAVEESETVVAAQNEPAVAPEANTAEADAASGEVDLPSGPAGGPLIPLDDQVTEIPHQEAALPQDAPQDETSAGAATADEAPSKAAETASETEASETEASETETSEAAARGWDLEFIERQIKQLDAITARVDGPAAATPGWDALEAWELETRGLLAARLGQDAANGLTMARQAPVVGDPFGNFHHASAAYRTYLSVLLDEL